MSWKHILVVALAAMLVVSACKKKPKEEKPVEQPPVAAQDTAPTPPPEDVAPAPAADAAPEPPPAGNACAGYVDKMIACAKEAAGGVELPAEILDQTKSAAEQGCSAWSAMGDALTKAMDSCKDKPCAEWGACVAQAITAAATAAVPAPTGGGGEACTGYVDKMIACAKEAASGVELPAEILDQTRSAAEQGCSAWSAMGDALTKAMDSCKDKPCAEWGACVAQAITAAATAAVPTP